MSGVRKNSARLKRLWLSGEYTSLKKMSDALAAKGEKVDLSTLKKYSAKDNWNRDKAAISPKIEAAGIAKLVAKEATRFARINTKLVELQEVLLEKVLATVRGKGKMKMEDALKGVRSVAELQARVINPLMPKRESDDPAPTGSESPGAAAMAQVTINMPGSQQHIESDAEMRPLDDADLEAAVRAGQGIIIDEKPKSAPRAKSKRKKGNKT